jgi:hypothetical protein
MSQVTAAQDSNEQGIFSPKRLFKLQIVNMGPIAKKATKTQNMNIAKHTLIFSSFMISSTTYIKVDREGNQDNLALARDTLQDVPAKCLGCVYRILVVKRFDAQLPCLNH